MRKCVMREGLSGPRFPHSLVPYVSRFTPHASVPSTCSVCRYAMSPLAAKMTA